jgi:hypothetical protein
MNIFLSHISFTALLFLPLCLSCSDHGDAQVPETTEKQLQAATTEITSKSTLQTLHGIVTSPTAQYLAKGTVAVASSVLSTAVNLTYQGAQMAANACNKNKETAKEYIPAKKQTPSPINEEGYDTADICDSPKNIDSQENHNFPGKDNWAFFRDVSTLKEKLNENITETTATLDKTTEDYFNKKNPADPKNQSEIAFIFKITEQVAQETNEPFSLSRIVAKRNKEKQEQIFTQTLDMQTNETEPNLINEYNATITIAQAQFDKIKQDAQITLEAGLKMSLSKLKTTAYNYCYMDDCSGVKSNDNTKDSATNIKNIHDTKAFQSFLARRRNPQIHEHSSSEQNNHSLSQQTSEAIFGETKISGKKGAGKSNKNKNSNAVNVDDIV